MLLNAKLTRSSGQVRGEPVRKQREVREMLIVRLSCFIIRTFFYQDPWRIGQTEIQGLGLLELWTIR